MQIRFARHFVKELRAAPPHIQQAWGTRLALFINNKFYSLLNNHNLTGKLSEYRSINITGDWRAIFCELANGEIISFERLGTHSRLYKK